MSGQYIQFDTDEEVEQVRQAMEELWDSWHSVRELPKHNAQWKVADLTGLDKRIPIRRYYRPINLDGRKQVVVEECDGEVVVYLRTVQR